ncbi:HEAT repeat domain-containing protein [Planctomicrobium piriforme]|nr:HEAT repeat domain-containing protein [Planctomicrobium piriforme]
MTVAKGRFGWLVWGAAFLISAQAFAEERRYGGQTVLEWHERIKNESLQEMARPDVVAGLLEIVNDPQAGWANRRQAALTLGRIGAPAAAAVPDLIRLLNSGERDATATRMWALRALALLGTAAADATTAVAGIINDQNEPFFVQATALETLGCIGKDRPETLPVLLAALQSDQQRPVNGNNELRMAAAEAMGLLGPAAAAAIPELIRALHSDWGLLQRAAAESLGRIGPQAELAAPNLADVVLFSTAEEAREAAAEALALVGESGISILEKLSRDEEPDVRRLSIRGLAKCPAIPSVQSRLMTLLDDAEPANQVVAAQALLNRQLEKERAVSVLIDLLGAEDRSTRQLAYRVLSARPELLRGSAERLQELAHDQHAPTTSRTAALKLLRFLGP